MQNVQIFFIILKKGSKALLQFFPGKLMTESQKKKSSYKVKLNPVSESWDKIYLWCIKFWPALSPFWQVDVAYVACYINFARIK